MIKIIDIHCHLTFEQYNADREQVVAGAKKVLKAVVTSGVEPGDARLALELSERHEGFVFATLGLHPIHVAGLTGQEVGEYAEFVSENRRRIVGIGEVGLDYHWVRDPLKVKRMKEVFVEFLGLAKELGLPVVLHLRGSGSGTGSGTSSGALEEGLKTLLDEDIKKGKAVFHCFTGKPQLAERICEEGYFVSLPASIVRSKTMKKVAKRIPLSSLLTETDAPYLSPVEVEGEGAEKRRRNVPQNVKAVYEEVARQRKTEVPAVEREVERNFERVFGVELR
ncbi:MAG: TatD family hydrolase [Methanophagales archaeon]|nr:TatD family hydrolase [Methanophagales archaeon]